MFKKIIILSLTMACAQAIAGWTITPYASAGDGTFYWDVQHVTVTHDGLTIWTAVDFGKTHISKVKPGHNYLSLKEELELNCIGSQYKVINYIEYSDHLGKGNVVAQNQNQTEWRAIEPDTFTYEVKKTYCKKP